MKVTKNKENTGRRTSGSSRMKRSSTANSRLGCSQSQCAFVTFSATELMGHILKGHRKVPGSKEPVSASNPAYESSGFRHFKCTFCGSAKETRKKLYRHMLYHTILGKFKCNHCNYWSSSSQIVARHEKACHDPPSEEEMGEPNLTTDGIEMTSPEELPCTAPSSKSLMDDEDTMPLLQPVSAIIPRREDELLWESPPTLQMEVSPTSSSSFKVDKPEKNHSGAKLVRSRGMAGPKSKLKKRERVENLKRPYPCELCIFWGKTEDNLARHMTVHQKGRVAVTRAGCGNQRKQRQQKQCQHKQRESLKCSVCPLRSKYSRAIARHEVLFHKNCKATPNNKNELQTSGGAGSTNKVGCSRVKPGISLRRKYSIKRTLRSEYKCSLCDFITSDEELNRLHANGHKEIKAYKCCHCDWYTDSKDCLAPYETVDHCTTYKSRGSEAGLDFSSKAAEVPERSASPEIQDESTAGIDSLPQDSRSSRNVAKAEKDISQKIRSPLLSGGKGLESESEHHKDGFTLMGEQILPNVMAIPVYTMGGENMFQNAINTPPPPTKRFKADPEPSASVPDQVTSTERSEDAGNTAVSSDRLVCAHCNFTAADMETLLHHMREHAQEKDDLDVTEGRKRKRAHWEEHFCVDNENDGGPLAVAPENPDDPGGAINIKELIIPKNEVEEPGLKIVSVTSLAASTTPGDIINVEASRSKSPGPSTTNAPSSTVHSTTNNIASIPGLPTSSLGSPGSSSTVRSSSTPDPSNKFYVVVLRSSVDPLKLPETTTEIDQKNCPVGKCVGSSPGGLSSCSRGHCLKQSFRSSFCPYWDSSKLGIVKDESGVQDVKPFGQHQPLSGSNVSAPGSEKAGFEDRSEPVLSHTIPSLPTHTEEDDFQSCHHPTEFVDEKLLSPNDIIPTDELNCVPREVGHMEIGQHPESNCEDNHTLKGSAEKEFTEWPSYPEIKSNLSSSGPIGGIPTKVGAQGSTPLKDPLTLLNNPSPVVLPDSQLQQPLICKTVNPGSGERGRLEDRSSTIPTVRNVSSMLNVVFIPSPNFTICPSGSAPSQEFKFESVTDLSDFL